MSTTDVASEGTLETRKDAGPGAHNVVRFWLDAIKLADKEEEDWRKIADDAYKIYAASEKKRSAFNILYSNVETIVPAVYNSTPVPDIRARDLRMGRPELKDDPSVVASRDVASIVERTLTVMLDQYDFDLCVEMAVKDGQIGGRGVTRVRYEPKVVDDAVAWQATYCETVTWSEFRRGPGRRWSEVPFIAFRHYMTRDQLVALSEKNGGKVPLSHSMKLEEKDASRGPEAEVFKRALVWEIWDKQKREVVFISPSFTEEPIVTLGDDLKLRDFYPIPRPLQDVNRPDDLTPICPLEQYKEQAKELDEISKRILRLTRAVKARGIYDSSMRSAFSAMADIDDGELAPSDQSLAVGSIGGLDKAIWFMPIEAIVAALVQLVAQRESIKQTIYEIIGISDILRGQVDPREKAAQSNLKAQWGASRLHTRQKDTARYARDLIRMMAEIIANHFTPQVLQVIAAMPVTPEHIAMMRSDGLMSFRVDIETDSTIQADTQRTQQNAGQFVQGFGTFIQALGPAVEAGVMPLDVAADLLKSFARSFKLGKQAEDALERLGQQAAAQSGQPKQDPAAMKAQAEIGIKTQEAQMKQQLAQHDAQIKQQIAQQNAEIAKMKAQMDMAIAEQKMRQDAQMAAQKAAIDQAKTQSDIQLKRETAQQDMALRAQQSEQEMAIGAQTAQAQMDMQSRDAEQNARIRDAESRASIEAKRKAAANKPMGER